MIVPWFNVGVGDPSYDGIGWHDQSPECLVHWNTELFKGRRSYCTEFLYEHDTSYAVQLEFQHRILGRGAGKQHIPNNTRVLLRALRAESAVDTVVKRDQNLLMTG